MRNSWELLLQTGTVSLAAGLILAVKELLRDKLSPRWQYWLWALLAARVLIPAHAGRTLVIGLGLPLELLKTAAEGRLNSAYSGPWDPVGPDHILPVFSGAPQSITDWLFVMWWAGAAVYLAVRLLGYVRLRLLLRRGSPVSPALSAQLEALCSELKLRPCRAVEVQGLPSAFVCGIFRPVLAVPAGEQIDDKVLLHELLHLRHRDPLQTALWCVLRALHWCNPVLQLVFDRIGNDLESLCDQRVLERLEGQQLREYGTILLTMAAGRYARMPGTSSVSNGSKNISRRIEAIARFKRYPQGMGLVAFCILLVLARPLLVGNAMHVENNDLRPGSAEELDAALARTRIRRCTTLPGALDTYAKGLMLDNGVFLAAASPLDRQPVLRQQLLDRKADSNYSVFYLPADRGLQYIAANADYQVCDLEQQPDGSYSCWLAFPVYYYEPGEGPQVTWDGSTNSCGTCFVPMKAWQEGDAWVALEPGEGENRILSAKGPLQVTMSDQCDLPARVETVIETGHGPVRIQSRSTHSVGNATVSQGLFQTVTTFDQSIKPDAAWDRHSLSNIVYYTPSDRSAIEQLLEVRIQSFPSKEEAEKFTYPTDGLKGGTAYSNDFGTWSTVSPDRLEETHWFWANTDYGKDVQQMGATWFRVQIRWDDRVVEEFVVQEGDHVGP